MGKRIPKKGDKVLALGRNASFIVFDVHRNPDVVDLQPMKGTATLDLIEKGIPWRVLTFIDEMDESQNALRVVREATEDS